MTDDYETMVDIRVRIPFDAMYKAGLIRGYHVFHRGRLARSVGIPAETAAIDVVWVQRVLVRSLLFVADSLRGQFVYDIDDNLLVTPAYQGPFSPTTTGIVRALLREAKVVSSPSARLLGSLQARSGLPLDGKSVIAPNMAEEVVIRPGGPDPDVLLLAMSGRLPLTASYDGFMSGVGRFLRRRGLPVLYIGSQGNDFSMFGTNVQSTGLLDYFTYREVIRSHNAMAVVPLEGRGDPSTQEFVESKSDIKMVEFGSCGVAAVYADVAPYQDTPLRCGPLADMGDERAVHETLDQVFGTTAEMKAAAEDSVREHRLALRCVASTWFRAVEAGQLSHPLSLEGLLRTEAGYAALSLSPDAQLAALDQRDWMQPAHAGQGGPPAPGAPSSIRPPRAVRPNFAASLVAAAKRIRRPADDLRGHEQTPLFDPEFYLATYPDVRASGTDPYLHYREHGIAERRNPNPFFETRWYISRHPDAGLPGVDPLQHYLAAAADAAVDPGPRFSSRLYRVLNPGLAGANPLEHYLRRAARQARPISADEPERGALAHGPHAKAGQAGRRCAHPGSDDAPCRATGGQVD